MGTISRQYTFVAGAVPTADNWNADWSQILTLVNGQVDKGNVDSSSSDGICTLDENQSITGVKTFTTAQVFNNGITINEGSNDSDTRIETNNMANAVVVDAGLDCISFGAAAVDDTFVQVAKGATTSAATQNTYHLNVAPGGATTIPSGTTAYVGSVNINEPNITATGTVTNAFTLRIAGAPTEGGTNNYALWVDAGATQLDGTLTTGVDDTGVDVKFFGATSGQYLLWDESADELVLTGDSKLSFHDAAGGENIIASADGHLEVNAGTTLDMSAPTVDINGTTTVTIDGGSSGFSIDGGAASNLATSAGALTITSAVAATWSTTAGDLTITAGGGDISFDNENLSTTGTLASGALTVTGAITGSGVLSVDDPTESTSTVSGSIHTDGGLGVAKSLWVGGDINPVEFVSQGISNYGAATKISVADTETITFNMNTGAIILLSDLSTGAGASFAASYNHATITKLHDPNTNYTVNSDADGGLWNIYKSVNSQTITVVNNNTTTRELSIHVLGQVTTASGPS